MKKRVSLNTGWLLFPSPEATFPEGITIPEKGIAAEVPGTVHSDLLNAGLIPDPFFADNELKVSWVHELDWIYRTSFALPPDFSPGEETYLICEGLDTISQISVNGKTVGSTTNMFRKYRFPVSSLINQQDNSLEIRFTSPTRYGREQEAQYGKLPVERLTCRVYLRKAQYSFGWDWGPAFPTMGIWRSIYLEQPGKALIQTVRFHTADLQQNMAKVMIQVDLEGKPETGMILRLMMESDNQQITEEIPVQDHPHAEHIMEVHDPQLWWPNGEGEAHLYDLNIALLDTGGNELDTWSGKIGIRTVTLQTKEKGDPVFRFLINGRPVYMKGANWIPADTFLPRVTPEKYNILLQRAKDSHMNMLRVWGGGIYEDDHFYRRCDELGILVWQDFMFACAGYPEHQTFLEDVEKEIRQNVDRLQHHPSVAIWCGNNENEWIWFRKYHKAIGQMPGFKIYHSFIPGILQTRDPMRPYWPSSPFGSGPDPNAQEDGNRHQWDIWSRWVDYTEVNDDRSLFVTEFGFQAPANKPTLETALPPAACHPHAPLFEFHNKQEEGNERLFRYLAGHLPLRTQWEDFIYLTQLNQALALKTCLEHWRQRWPYTGGSIIWQLNDCWPVSSWSLVDSALLPKISYYWVREAFSPLSIHIKESDNTLKIFVLNYSREVFRGRIHILLIEDETGKYLHEHSVPVYIDNGLHSEMFEMENTYLPMKRNWVLLATLYDEHDHIQQRNFFPGNRWKHKKLPDPRVRITLEKTETDDRLLVQCAKPAYFVDLQHPRLQFPKRGFILLPGETLQLEISGRIDDSSALQDLKIFTLNHYKNEV